MGKLRIKNRTVDDIFKELKNIAKLIIQYKSSVAVYTVMALLSTAFGILTSLVSQSLIDFVTMSPASDNILKFNSIYGILGAAVAFAVFGIGFSAVNSRISEKIRIRVNTDMTASLFDKYICSKWEYSSLFASGDVLNRFNSDISTVSSSVIGIIPTLITRSFQLLAAFAVIFYYDRIMALIALVTIPISLIFSRFLVVRMHRYARELKKINSKMMAFNSDALLNIQYLKSFGLVNIFCAKLREIQKEYIDISLDYNKFSIVITSAMSFIAQIVSYACFGWGVYRLWSHAISIGTLVLFVQLYGMLSSSFSSIINVVPTLINSVAASERISEIQNLPKDEELDDPESMAFFEGSKNKKLILEMKDVSFKYIDEDEAALNSANFKAETGDFIALTGPSGEGKTTMLRLFLALLEPNEGEIKIIRKNDGRSLNVSPATRKFFSYVPQKNGMFGDTLAANMRLVKPDATDDEIKSALKISCAYDFVMKEKSGIYCKIGDGGVGFSEGQMQRISIARAVLRDAPIVLLDEATSALDTDTEKQVLMNLSEWCKNKICIFTSHRSSIFEVCNKAYVVSETECSELM